MNLCFLGGVKDAGDFLVKLERITLILVMRSQQAVSI